MRKHLRCYPLSFIEILKYIQLLSNFVEAKMSLVLQEIFAVVFLDDRMAQNTTLRF